MIYRYVVKVLIRILSYRHTFEFILVINLNNMIICGEEFEINHVSLFYDF
jgi:hypothetical protein